MMKYIKIKFDWLKLQKRVVYFACILSWQLPYKFLVALLILLLTKIFLMLLYFTFLDLTLTLL